MFPGLNSLFTQPTHWLDSSGYLRPPPPSESPGSPSSSHLASGNFGANHGQAPLDMSARNLESGHEAAPPHTSPIPSTTSDNAAINTPGDLIKPEDTTEAATTTDTMDTTTMDTATMNIATSDTATQGGIHLTASTGFHEIMTGAAVQGGITTCKDQDMADSKQAKRAGMHLTSRSLIAEAKIQSSLENRVEPAKVGASLHNILTLSTKVFRSLTATSTQLMCASPRTHHSRSIQ